VAHNAEFDMRMLSYELQRQSKTPLKPQLLVCTRDLASRFNWTSSGNRLYEAALRYQVPQDGAHRAAVDARTCGLVLSAMLKRHSLPEDIQRMVEFCVSANNAWKSKRRR
jgi:DNA polymerase III epsilon subunit-like protein